MPRYLIAALVVAPFLTAVPVGAEVPPFIAPPPPIIVTAPVVFPVFGATARGGRYTGSDRSGADFDKDISTNRGTVSFGN